MNRKAKGENVSLNTARADPAWGSLRLPGIDSEAVMGALKGVAAVSNGSAWTSSSYSPSHVLTAMGLSDEECQEAVRISWGPESISLTPTLSALATALEGLSIRQAQTPMR